MRTTVTQIGLAILLFAVTLGLTGCGSGGTSGNNPDGSEDETSSIEKADAVMVSLKEEEENPSTEKAKAQVKGYLIVDFHYENDSGSGCTLSKEVNDVSPGYNKKFSPSNIKGECEGGSEFDAVQAYYNADSKAPRMILSILTANGGDLIASIRSDNVQNGIKASRAVSEEVSIPDVGGGDVDSPNNDPDDDDSGDDISGGDNAFDSASELANTVRAKTWRTKNKVEPGVTLWVRMVKLNSDLDVWTYAFLGSACNLDSAPFTIIDGSTIEIGYDSTKADVSYSNGELTIDEADDPPHTLIRPDKDKDPFQDRCDFSEDTYDRLGY